MAIQQRLHTKLVQKLILTPSLQQAIKLLPMSTIELADMLNQEVVENPMLEEVPTEDIQANDQIAQTEREDGAGEPAKPTHAARELGRQRLRLLLRRLPRRRLARQPRPGRGQGTAADREHALDPALARRAPGVAAVDVHGRRHGPRDRRGDHRQPRRRRLPDGVGRRDCGDGRLEAGRRREGADDHAALRSRSASRRATCRNASRCSCATSASPTRRPSASSPSTCGCCRTTRSRRSRGGSA